MVPSENWLTLAASLDGYTGSDIKEVCREAVVRVSHERAQQIESGALAEDGRSTSAKFVYCVCY